VKSGCLSVHPVETELGRKTQIHQGSCNKDYSCLLGDCPSFLTVTPLGNGSNGSHAPRSRRAPFVVDRALPEPAGGVPAEGSVFMTGIGGTGVVTVNQLLGTAALLDGKHVRGLDQTGLSQKGGPVVSHLKVLAAPAPVSSRVGVAGADCYLGFDVLVATAARNLEQATPERTRAVVSTSQVPTGAMVASTEVRFPETAALLTSIDRVTRKDENVYLDAVGLAETLFDDHLAANVLLLGAAWQAGAIPVAAAAIERAIALNGVAVELNTQAFRAGRMAVADPAWVGSLRRTRAGAVAAAPALGAEARAVVDAAGAEGELRRLLEARVPELVAYQDAAYARSYVDFVRRVAAAEAAATPGRTALAEAVARHLFKLMAYKDEYEVARLHLGLDLGAQLADRYPGGVRVEYHLHPPLLRALGLRRKLRLGPWFRSPLRLLASLKRLRGTALDPFGYASLRRTERALIGEYRGLVEQALAGLGPDSHERAVRLARLPDVIRGYEGVKLRGVARFRQEARALGFGVTGERGDSTVLG
jgi:indolepyruvate ferredoxin oxidoreductase